MSMTTINAANINFYDNYRADFFAPKVTINAHTPYDAPKETQDKFSRKDFYKTETKNPTLTVKTDDIKPIDAKSPSNSAIVKDMISKGYCANDAININRALNTYGLSTMYSNGAEIVNTTECEA